MNPKLREFERASGLEIYGLGAKRIPWEAALEKYAELIINECANVADRHTYDGDWDIARMIKQHFGIDK
jgi:hypothetical protein